MTGINDFIHELDWRQIPEHVKASTQMALLDLLGVAASGTSTRLSEIIRDHAVNHFGAPGGGAQILFDGRQSSIPGAALAGGMLIDSVDAHDGFKPTKGHVGCGVLPAVLAFSELDRNTTEDELLTRLLVGYEIGGRAGIGLHASVSDYHTSGAWIALAAAAVGTRSLKLDSQATREALGIAEYHGPRSQMMRCIDHPTMLKDGSGWGSMAGCSAALLAQDGFTGAPALTVESEELDGLWSDLGSRWMVCEQYIKAYPVCRWAQPAIAGVLAIKQQHAFKPDEVKAVEIQTFHESKRLAMRVPQTTEQAQYSLPFPVAAAIVHNDVGVEHIDGDGLRDEDVLRISNMIQLSEVDEYNQCFPEYRKSNVVIELADGTTLESGTIEAAGDPEMPFSRQQIEDKFIRFASGPLGDERAVQIKSAVSAMGCDSSIQPFCDLIYQTPVNSAAVGSSG